MSPIRLIAVPELLDVARRTDALVEPGRPSRIALQSAYNPMRRAHNALHLLARSAREDVGGLVLRVIDVPIFVPALPFVVAWTEGQRGIVSSTFLSARAVESAIEHVIGRLQGLPHCRNRRCALWLARTIDEIEDRGPTLCEACRRSIGQSETL